MSYIVSIEKQIDESICDLLDIIYIITKANIKIHSQHYAKTLIIVVPFIVSVNSLLRISKVRYFSRHYFVPHSLFQQKS